MMQKEIYDPLKEYINVYQKRFKDVTKATFAELAEEANVDREANRTTCEKIRSTEKRLSAVEERIKWWKIGKKLVWGTVAVVLLLFLVNMDGRDALFLIKLGAIGVLGLVFLIVKIYPILKGLRRREKELDTTITTLKEQAWKQMEPLNSLFDWDLLTQMMSKTVPQLEFDPYFTTQRLADLQNTYGWDGSFNKERSILYSHSGLINGNPFVLCRTRKMEMGTRTYTGTKTISWKTYGTDSYGNSVYTNHSQTLKATVTAPYPDYFEKAWLIYGNTAAPNLVFNRKKSGLAGKEGSFAYRRVYKALKKKSRQLRGNDYAMMTNEEFEVAFDSSDRNSNHEFALLFTPLAQESMLHLLKDEVAGYGDSFDFLKERMINTIIPYHLQELDFDLNPQKYRSYDYEEAESGFHILNASYFRAIYFSLAPLLCVPMYQQIRPFKEIYGYDMQRHSSFWEHEALANFWGEKCFMHPQCVTNCILKTEEERESDDRSVIKVHAHGFRAEQQLSYVKVRGDDGNWHDVPVYWYEYLPVTGEGEIEMREDNDFNDGRITHQERLNHIKRVLKDSSLSVYRRHIASKL